MIYISIFLFILSYFFLPKTKKFLVFFGISLFLYFFLVNSYVIANYFTWKWVDESVIYHIFYWLEWAWFWENFELIIFWSIFLIISIILPFLFYFFTKKNYKNIKKSKKIFFIIFMFLAFLTNPIFKNFYDLWYLDFFDKNDISKLKYEVPEFKKKTEKTKNIVYLYLESFENLYTNDDIFPSLTPNLNELKKKSVVFENVDQAYGTSWTIAWMVWSQCWTPLINSGWWWNSMHWIEDFLPWAFCIWDFLKKANYELSYIWWAKIEFAWKWNFYKTHSFDNVSWKKELEYKLKDKDYQTDWWFYDDTTFGFVFEEFERLSKTWKNFMLATLTLDTHGDKWVISKSCPKIYDKNDLDSILNSYHCSDFLVWELVKKIQNSPAWKDTIIVISSDHFAMNQNNSFPILKKNQEKRRNLFMIIDSEESKKIYKKATTLDIWPTILTKAWFYVEKLWFWVNLFWKNESLPNSILKKFRKVYESFWTFPSLKKWIFIELEKNNLILNWKNIKFPVLIFLNEKNDTEKIIWPDIDNPNNIFEMKNKKTILINNCENREVCIKFINNSFDEKTLKFSEDKEISYDEILKNILKKN